MSGWTLRDRNGQLELDCYFAIGSPWLLTGELWSQMFVLSADFRPQVQ